MMNLDDCCANLQNFHELAKLIVCGISFYGLFITLVFRVLLKSDDKQFQNWWYMKVRQ